MHSGRPSRAPLVGRVCASLRVPCRSWTESVFGERVCGSRIGATSHRCRVCRTLTSLHMPSITVAEAPASDTTTGTRTNGVDIDRVTPLSPSQRALLQLASPTAEMAQSLDSAVAEGARTGRSSTLRSSIVSMDTMQAAAIVSTTLRKHVLQSALFALKGGLWAIVMGIPSLIIILARIPSLENFGRAVATHDPEHKYPPTFTSNIVAGASAPPDFPPDSFWRLTWMAHLDESLQNTIQAFSAFLLVVLHLTYTHKQAHEPQMKKLRWFVFLVCMPAFLLQLFGRTLMFTSIIAQNALIYIPWTIAVVVCSKRCKAPLGCSNFAFSVAFETFGYMLIGAIYIFILVPIVMVGAPGRQAIILVISLPLIRTMGTTISRFGAFIAIGIAPEHACVFGLIVPCAVHYRLLLCQSHVELLRLVCIVISSHPPITCCTHLTSRRHRGFHQPPAHLKRLGHVRTSHHNCGNIDRQRCDARSRVLPVRLAAAARQLKARHAPHAPDLCTPASLSNDRPA